MKIKYLSIFLLLAMLILPASANTVSGTAPTGQAVWALDITTKWGTSGTFTLNLENGDTVEGDWSYSGFPTTFEATIGDDTSSYSYITPTDVYLSIWNGDNVTYSREVKLGYGQIKGAWNDVVATSIGAKPIISYSITSTGPVSATPEYIKYSDAVANLNYKPPDTISQMIEYAPMLWGVFTSLIYWLKLIFVDNLVLTVSLYMAGTMAYAANTSRNIFVFFRTWFRQQKALFEFMANGFLMAVSIIGQLAVVITGGISALVAKFL